MKWFDKWFTKKVHRAMSIPQEKEEADRDIYLTPSPKRGINKASRGGLVTGSGDNELESRGVSFTLYNANGGHVVELRHYDEKADRMKNSLHIVPHDKDLGQELNHIITYEALKR